MNATRTDSYVKKKRRKKNAFHPLTVTGYTPRTITAEHDERSRRARSGVLFGRQSSPRGSARYCLQHVVVVFPTSADRLRTRYVTGNFHVGAGDDATAFRVQKSRGIRKMQIFPSAERPPRSARPFPSCDAGEQTVFHVKHVYYYAFFRAREYSFRTSRRIVFRSCRSVVFGFLRVSRRHATGFDKYGKVRRGAAARFRHARACVCLCFPALKPITCGRIRLQQHPK